MKKMNLMTPINPLGYGVAGLNIFKELVKNIDVTLFPIRPIEDYNQADANLVSEHMEWLIAPGLFSDVHEDCYVYLSLSKLTSVSYTHLRAHET